MTERTESTGPEPAEESLRCLCSSMFHGKRAWMSIVGVVYGVVFTVVAIVTAIMFFRVDSIRGMIGYATVFAVSCAFAAITEMWFWNMMWRNSLAMRIDRLESHLSEQLAPKAEKPGEKPGQAA